MDLGEEEVDWVAIGISAAVELKEAKAEAAAVNGIVAAVELEEAEANPAAIKRKRPHDSDDQQASSVIFCAI